MGKIGLNWISALVNTKILSSYLTEYSWDIPEIPTSAYSLKTFASFLVLLVLSLIIQLDEKIDIGSNRIN